MNRFRAAKRRGRPLGSATLRAVPTRLMPAEAEINLYAKRLGVIVREAREERGISSRTLAEAAGVHTQTVQQIERGGKRNSRGPYVQTLIRIARTLGLNPRELMP